VARPLGALRRLAFGAPSIVKIALVLREFLGSVDRHFCKETEQDPTDAGASVEAVSHVVDVHAVLDELFQPDLVAAVAE